MATKYLTNLARALLGQSFDDLSSKEQRVIESLASGEPIAENTNQVFLDQSTYWQRLADALANVVGSWPFIFSFFFFLLVWVGFNTLILSNSQYQFDAYPFIFLNLLLSTLASIQAPIIMMSQNRQAEKDRISSSNAFEVNLKIELAIQQLHEKVDKVVEKID
ncbi:MAG: putative membrane protein [Candidatus Azotimanducaceae bacterium]|jgi:uncharacterized membrane protein